MNATEYRKAELKRELAAIAATDRAPLSDRQDARASWRECLTDRRTDYTAAEYLRERCAWIANGSYGAGALFLTRDRLSRCTTAKQKRVLLFCALARLDHSCPEAFAAQVWKELPVDLQREIDAALDEAAGEFESICAESEPQP